MTVNTPMEAHGLLEHGNTSPLDTAPRARSRTMLDMAMLYASKTGAVLVGIFILPQFNHLLGAQQFGVVAVIFSFQALLLILDLGMSTLVGRDIAAADPAAGGAVASWRTAEMVISAFYVVLLPLALLSTSFMDMPLSPGQVLATLLLFWAMTVQNIGQAALLAKHHFIEAGSIQVLGVATRGVVTLLALNIVGANLTVFLAAQVTCSLAQVIATHIRCAQLLRTVGSSTAGFDPSLAQCGGMVRRGGSLMLFGIAGAAVMQLDKPIVSAFTSATEMAPYYLATMLCLTPLSILAGPVAQFFQPRLIRAIASGDTTAAQSVLRPFVTAIVFITFLPSALLWLVREPVISAWLGHSEQVTDVAHYTAILLPGVAIGALGYVPYLILVARQDYRFQARASMAMTALTLVATVLLAHNQSVEGVCWVYTIYHASSTLMSWARCILGQSAGAQYAPDAALRTLTLVAIASLTVMVVAITAHLI